MNSHMQSGHDDAPDAHIGHATGQAHDMSGMAVGATLHCLTGCAIGEIIGLLVGTAAGWSNLPTTILSIGLAFVFGYSLSALPLVRGGIALSAALSLVLVADTLSIATMEIVDNLVMLVIPGAMNAGLLNPIFWVSMAISLTVAFFAAWPVNRALLRRGKGHAVTHRALGDAANMDNRPLVIGISAFLVGGLVASLGSLLG
ncbi:DUF4396 domain-containing protein [Brevibacterium oceani]|uniref:DUF4396 domain-containing protein n=1 Tax=Brevibacterium oceani TaxID=358099 RepID=UPI002159E773|nr:DUF4396 domain-containing protein [Brevibacterium oceani]